MSSVESLYDQLLERMREEQDKYLEEFKTPESFIDTMDRRRGLW